MKQRGEKPSSLWHLTDATGLLFISRVNANITDVNADILPTNNFSICRNGDHCGKNQGRHQ
ncbi:hypothetical protein BN439_2268 [Erwinia amylovora Ea644]|nr:hypothetical protein BN439_2268 [Erwinia amylovora Ea644]CCP07337.1 hypothetical protein BN440_2315 [Erwinia amylovora MR1]